MSSDIPRPGRSATEDPFRLGFRSISDIGPDGQPRSRQIPLTEHDLLFPQEGDQFVQNDAHIRDWVYLRETFRHALKDRPAARVFIDHRVDFALKDVEPLGPDLIVVDEMPQWDPHRGTLDLKEGGRVLLVLEITSESTRGNDFGIKRDYYAQARVPLYVLVDHLAGARHDEMGLRGFELRRGRYVEVALVEGRLWLEPLKLWLGIEEGMVFAYTEGGERIEEPGRILEQMGELEQALRVAEEQMAQEVTARHAAQRATREAERQAREAGEARTQAEAQARKEADARQQAEAARLQAENETREAGEARTQAEAQARKEADARQQAEAARLQAETQARQATEARRQAEIQASEAAEARNQAELQAREAATAVTRETEARKVAVAERDATEEQNQQLAAQLAAMQEELARLRGQP